MNLSKKIFQKDYMDLELQSDTQIESLPFYIKKIGFSNARKFTCGNANNYSDYMFLYAIDPLIFTKHEMKQPISANDIVVSSCNTPLLFHQIRRKKSNFIYMIISGKHAQQFYNMIRTNNCIYRTNQYSNMLNLFISLMSIDYHSNLFFAQMEAGTLIHQLFYGLYKISLDVIHAKKMLPPQDSAINTAIKYIEKNYKNDINIDTICNSVGFSKYYFCKMFKEHTGVTLHQYVTEYRINQSKNLLSYSKLSITAVANSVGYKNTLTFTRNFEHLQHMTPSEYRKYY